MFLRTFQTERNHSWIVDRWDDITSPRPPFPTITARLFFVEKTNLVLSVSLQFSVSTWQRILDILRYWWRMQKAFISRWT
jgi:hypothetical protein